MTKHTHLHRHRVPHPHAFGFSVDVEHAHEHQHTGYLDAKRDGPSAYHRPHRHTPAQEAALARKAWR